MDSSNVIKWTVVRQFRAAPIEFIVAVFFMFAACTAKTTTEAALWLILSKLFVNDVNALSAGIDNG